MVRCRMDQSQEVYLWDGCHVLDIVLDIHINTLVCPLLFLKTSPQLKGMIYSLVLVPCRELVSSPSLPDDLAALFTYVGRVGLISPVLLRLEDASQLFIEGHANQLSVVLKQIVRLAPCHIEAVPLPSDKIDPTVVEEFAIGLLGIYFVFFAFCRSVQITKLLPNHQTNINQTLAHYLLFSTIVLGKKYE